MNSQRPYTSQFKPRLGSCEYERKAVGALHGLMLQKGSLGKHHVGIICCRQEYKYSFIHLKLILRALQRLRNVLPAFFLITGNMFHWWFLTRWKYHRKWKLHSLYTCQNLGACNI